MGRKTPLYSTHLERHAKIVDFGGWDMPLHYGSQLEEHHAVRRDAGMFDVSHMCVIDLTGQRTREFLRYLLANDVDKLKTPGKALYSCMLNDAGGVLDDLIVYFLRSDFYRLVVNAGTRDKDLAWIGARARGYGVQVRERDDLAMLAVQGPNAREKTAVLLTPAARTAALSLQIFCGADCDDWFVARTGYTGEDGFEIMLPAALVAGVWNALAARGVSPAGLGARDTLRLEAGMNLYGNDMDETIDPLQSGLSWTVAFEPATRDFLGRAALEKIRVRPRQRLVGLLLEDRGVLRNHQRVISEDGAGEITSGGFSPTLNRSIALARIATPSRAAEEASSGQDAGRPERVQVDVRGKLLSARIVKPPFVRNGAARISIES